VISKKRRRLDKKEEYRGRLRGKGKTACTRKKREVLTLGFYQTRTGNGKKGGKGRQKRCPSISLPGERVTGT